MDKTYNHLDHESKIYQLWESSGAFKSETNPNGKPYTILMPPPNANASLHAGHAMYTVDDILIRWKRMQGFATLWQPGMDHAGFETQYVYEKHLAKEGKSRLDFDRQTLYDNIFKFVKENSGLIYEQFKRLGFSADWTRSVFTLDQHVITQVYETFTKMEQAGLVYRAGHIVNYCTHCGTSLAELEVEHEVRVEPLYYIKYGPFTLATVRPETKFGDTAVAVHPKDKRYQKWVGQEIEGEGLLSKFKIKVIADDYVDPEFGTGVVKITPAHDPNDFAVWQRHQQEMPPPKQVIDFNGRLTELAGKYQGLKVNQAREVVVKDLQDKGLIEKIDSNYEHSVITCYKCKRVLEPLIVPNWFIKVAELKQPIIEAVKKNRIKFYPQQHKRHMLQWLELMHDWPISRQIVWGIRIPVWYDVHQNPDIYVIFLNNKQETIKGTLADILTQYNLSEIKDGLQMLRAPQDAKYVVSFQEPTGDQYIQETDTFDTWFSSGQWPLVTLKENEFAARYPTDFMGTLSDILKFWISRMILFGLYVKQEIPFKDVYLWSMVADAKGVKMSKSKGNVINPLDLVDKYGADALRMSLMYGIPAGSKVILSEDKVRGMRNFANKLWNIGRFLKLTHENYDRIIFDQNVKSEAAPEDQEITRKLNNLEQEVTSCLELYKLNEAAQRLYDFIWHELADDYIEKIKTRLQNKDIAAYMNLSATYFDILTLLHPFMPFVTEAIWSELKPLRQNPDQLLIVAPWPTSTSQN